MPIKKCPNCGYKLNRKFKICRNCGARISKKSENAPVLGELDENFKSLTDNAFKLVSEKYTWDRSARLMKEQSSIRKRYMRREMILYLHKEMLNGIIGWIVEKY